jgi:tetratricopeptide (TPR) repeat protein
MRVAASRIILAPALVVAATGLWWMPVVASAAGAAPAAEYVMKGKRPTAKSSPVIAAAKQYAEAIASGDRVAFGRLDFGCQFALVSTAAAPFKGFPPESAPVYGQCWTTLVQAHETAVEQRDEGVNAIWPGKGFLVFFRNELTSYSPSFFVMARLGLSPPGTGLRVEPMGSAAIPAASFRIRPGAPLVSVPAAVVRLRVTYKDPVTSPVTYASEEYNLTATVKTTAQSLKAVTVKWVVLSGLRKLGFPGDTAVLNMPVAGPGGDSVPFVTEMGGYIPNSGAWWKPTDAPEVLSAALQRMAQYAEQRDRIALLNRVLIVDPGHVAALTILTGELYQTLVDAGAAVHHVPIGDAALATRFNELYWNAYAQASRIDISYPRNMIGKDGIAAPTPADYLSRMFPAMERLARLQPDDLENRIRLGNAYRWNNDQQGAIATHDAVLKNIPPERAALKARVLLELAWSRIARVAWNRTFKTPDIQQAYTEAEEAFKLTDRPLDKFTATYTMAYAQAYMPNPDNHAMLEKLTEARRWYLQLAGASGDSWRYLLLNNTLKGVVEADPAFKPLLTAS